MLKALRCNSCGRFLGRGDLCCRKDSEGEVLCPRCVEMRERIAVNALKVQKLGKEAEA